jgi:hypothetical protein
VDETLRKVWSALADYASSDGRPVPLPQWS